MSSKQSILFVTSECAPLAQVGGLADVSAALPAALARLGHRPLVVMPAYSFLVRDTLEDTGLDVAFQWAGASRAPRLLKSTVLDPVPLYLLDAPEFHEVDEIYASRSPFQIDSLKRFAFFSAAALEVPRVLGHPVDVAHLNDWPTALGVFHARKLKIPSLLTVHNVGYQGAFPAKAMPLTGVDEREFSPTSLEHFGRLNLLKGGIHNADGLTTVSPTYAREIQTPSYGCGLDGVLRSRSPALEGILNGVDGATWNPSTDPYLAQPYHRDDLSGKMACKAMLQRLAGFPVRPDVPVFGLVTRMTHQKGLDVLAHAMRAILDLDVQMVLLGAGDAPAEEFFRSVARARPERFCAWIQFDRALAHQIVAGSDFFVMPSRYEPCGLNQMYSLLYGTLPLVRATGGLADTVQNYDESTREGTGFVLHDLTPNSLRDLIGWAVSTWYARGADVDQMRRRAMNSDFSWEASATKYEQAYLRAQGAARSRG